MPYIETKVNTQISPAQEEILKKRFAKAIEIFPGKSENWLMLNFEDNCRLWFKGDNNIPTAYVEVKIFGQISEIHAEEMTKQMCSILEEVLEIPSARCYIKYSACDTWGWNGGNF